MRTVLFSALVAAAPLFCSSVATAQSDPVVAATTQAEQPKAEPRKTTPPDNEPGAGQTAGGSTVGDPIKLAAPAQNPETKSAAATADKSYIIGAEDVLGVTVWGDARLSGTSLVRPDGRITMPLLGEIEAAGKTPEQVSQEIVQRLKAGDLMKSPQVTVQVQQINSRKYYIQGEVNKPGSNPLVVPTTVLEALVNAGGFRDFANTKKIRILRPQKGGPPKEFKFDYKAVSRGKNVDQNILLQPGDIIIVP